MQHKQGSIREKQIGSLRLPSAANRECRFELFYIRFHPSVAVDRFISSRAQYVLECFTLSTANWYVCDCVIERTSVALVLMRINVLVRSSKSPWNVYCLLYSSQCQCLSLIITIITAISVLIVMTTMTALTMIIAISIG